MPITLTTDEAIQILEDIARTGNNAAARIAAIKQLEAMRSEAEITNDDEELYPDELAARRRAT